MRFRIVLVATLIRMFRTGPKQNLGTLFFPFDIPRGVGLCSPWKIDKKQQQKVIFVADNCDKKAYIFGEAIALKKKCGKI